MLPRAYRNIADAESAQQVRPKTQPNDYYPSSDADPMRQFYACADEAAELRENTSSENTVKRLAELGANQSEILSLLMKRYHAGLRRRFVSHLLTDNLESLIQETWLRVCATTVRKAARYQADRHFSTWLFGIAHNVRIDHAVRRDATDRELMQRVQTAPNPEDRMRASDELRKRYLRSLVQGFRKLRVPDAKRLAFETLDPAMSCSNSFDSDKHQFVVLLCSIASEKLTTMGSSKIVIPEYVPIESTEFLETECSVDDSAGSDPERHAASEEVARMIQTCLRKLNSSQRRAFDLVYQKDHDPIEVARIMRREVGTVHNLLSIAKRTLKDCLKSYAGVSGSV